MKHSFSLTVVLLFTSNICFSQLLMPALFKGSKDLIQENLKGKIKTITESNFKVISKFGEFKKGDALDTKVSKYNEKGNKIEEEYNDYVFNNQNRHVLEYNANNYIITSTNYNPDNTIATKMIIKYDDRNRIEEMSSYTRDGVLLTKSKLSYDKETFKNYDIREYSANGTLSTKYSGKLDKNNNQIEWCTYEQTGSINIKEIFDYDSASRLLEKRVYQQGQIYLGKTTFEYDTKGKSTVQSEYDSSGVIMQKYSSKYDDNKQLIEWVSENTMDSTSQKVHYQYTYDKFDNWTTRTIFHYNALGDKVVTNMTERLIEYYGSPVSGTNLPDIQLFYNSFKKAVSNNDLQKLSETGNLAMMNYKNKSDFIKDFTFSENVKRIIASTSLPKKLIDNREYTIEDMDGNLLFIIIFKKGITNWKWHIAYVD